MKRVLLAALLMFAAGCLPTAPVDVLDNIAEIWPEARREIENSGSIDTLTHERLGEWDLAISARDADRIRDLRDRDWGKFRSLSDDRAVVELGEELARL